MTEARIDWAAHTTRLVDATTADLDWYRAVAHGWSDQRFRFLSSLTPFPAGLTRRSAAVAPG